MRLLKPTWVNHKGKPIFSVDIHPDGSRFATGGQGDDSGKIVIWNMAPVKDEKAEHDENVPKVLCQMDNHMACVNCVRWANNGRYLASCGDDKLIMIWQCSRSGGVSSTFGSNVVNLEHWTCASTLRGHSGDVLDLAWSPHDAWLASCSIDNTVIIWNAHKFPEQISVLRGHTSLVKGVTWDPVGKYLASQSDDRSLRIWRTLDWQQDACVTNPFDECGGTTHVLRLHWSPDGHYLVSAHAMNNSGPTAQIITRQGWKTDMDFVGHRKAITCVRFNPRILSKETRKESGKIKKQQFCCCAIGSRDRSLSVWLTAHKRPLLVMHDLFTNSVMDTSWSKSGFELICCSWDGTVAYLGFDEDEIGKALSSDEVSKLHQKLYGKSISQLNGTGPQIIESTAIMKLQQQQEQQKKEDEAKQKQQETIANGMVTPSKSQPPQVPFGSPNTPSKQIETRTKDGRRRIQPIFLAPPPDLGDGPLPFTTNFSTNFTSTTDRSQIVVEKKDPAPDKEVETVTEVNENTQTTPEETSMQPMSALGSKQPEKRKEPSDTPASEKSTKNKEEKREKEHKHKRRKEEKESSKEPSILVKRKLDIEKVRKRRKREKHKDSLSLSSLATPIVSEREPVATTTKVIYASSGLHLPVPDIERVASIKVTGESINLDIENGISADGHSCNKICCTEAGETVWESILAQRIIAACGSSRVVAVACDDQSVSLFSQTGRRLMPCLALDSQISQLHAAGYYVMAITSQGNLHVWNSQTLSAVISKVPLTTIIANDDISLQHCQLTDQGMAILSLSNKKSYTYSKNMGCWLLLSDNKDTIHNRSDHTGYVNGGLPSHGPLAAVQTYKSRSSLLASRLHRGNAGGQHVATVSHLESQVSAALALQSPAEYRFWFMAYIRCLVHENMENKLREICDDLLGPMYRSKHSNWSSHILTHKKRDLLREILPVIGSNLSLQRLFTEFHEQLDTVAGMTR